MRGPSVPQAFQPFSVAGGARHYPARVAAADVVIASNRGPMGFRQDANGAVTVARGGGGLVSAMAGLATGDGALWVCSALDDVDRDIASSAPDGRLDKVGYDAAGAVQMLPIDTGLFDAAYATIATATLWFVHHEILDDLPSYDAQWRQAWAGYVEYNQQFATAIARAAAQRAKVVVQDYHLSLLPALLRAERPDLRIAHFTHTPWASAGVFSEALPSDVGTDLLLGMLGADSLGFHSSRWAQAFADCCAARLPASLSDEAITHDDRRTTLRVHPLGVDRGPLLARAALPDVADQLRLLTAETGDRRVIARVDRTEPSKNIVRGLHAVGDLLRRFPEHREHIVHLAVAYPSRQEIPVYRRYTEEVRETAERINAEFGTERWHPIELSIVDDYPRSLATLAAADVLLVNPLRDGMNLVAKEGALLSDAVVLVLSKYAGAADEMTDAALIVDPFDVAATADALHEALTMSAEERARRHAGLAQAATALPPQQWLAAQLVDLD